MFLLLKVSIEFLLFNYFGGLYEPDREKKSQV